MKGTNYNELEQQTSAKLAGVISGVHNTNTEFKELLAQKNMVDFESNVSGIAQNIINNKLSPNISADSVTSYRNQLLSQELPYNYEAFDISKRFVSQHLIFGDLGSLSSPFLSDDIVNSLNNAVTLSQDEQKQLVMQLTNQQNVYSDERDRITNILANKNSSEKESFDTEVTKYRTDLQEQLTLLNNQDMDIKDKVSQAYSNAQEAQSEYVRYENQTKKMIEAIDNGEVYSTGTANSTRTKAQEERQKVLAKLQEYRDRYNKAMSEYQELVKQEQVIEQNKKVIQDTLSDPKKVEEATHNKLVNDIDELKSNIASSKVDMEQKSAETVANKVNDVWSNTDLSFKDLSQSEYINAVKTVKDPMAKEIISSAYAFDENSNTYKKSNYFLWEGDTSFNGSQSIKGVSDFATNDRNITPQEMSSYFTLTDAADKKVEDYYKNKYESNKNISELNKIKEVIEDYKSINKEQTLQNQLTTAKHIQQIIDGTVSVSDEIEDSKSDVAQDVATNAKVTSKLKRHPLASFEGTMKEYNWLNDKEAKLIGKDAIKELRKVPGLDDKVDRLIPKNKIEETVKTPLDKANEYALGLSKLFEKDKETGKSLADFIGLDEQNFKYKVDNHISSLKILDNTIKAIDSNDYDKIANVKSMLGEMWFNRDMPAATKIKSVTRALGYEHINDVADMSDLKEIVKQSASKVVDSLGSLDWEVLNAIRDTKDKLSGLSPEMQILAESRAKRGNELVEYSNNYDRGVAHKRDMSDPKVKKEMLDEANQSLWEDQHKVSDELDINDRVYMMKEQVLRDDKDRIISKIRQRELEVLNADNQANHMAIRVSNLGRNLTKEELEKGFVQLDKAIPVEHTSEFYNLMSLNKLRGQESQTPFTNEEWKNGIVSFGDKDFKISQFYEYYNKDIRKAQNDVIKKEELNNKLRDAIESEKKTITYKHRPRTTGDIKRPTVDIETTIPLFADNMPNKSPSRIFKSDIDKIVPVNPMTMGKDQVPATIDNIMDLADEYNVMLPQSIFDILKEYDYEDSNIRSNDITPDDAIEFFKYKDNQLFTDRAQSRVMYIPKPADPQVKSTLEEIQANPEYLSLRRRQDALTYDVLSVDGDYVTTRASRWVAPSDLTLTMITNSNSIYDGLDEAQKVMDIKSGFDNKEAIGLSNYKDTINRIKSEDNSKMANILIGDTYFSRNDLYTKFLSGSYTPITAENGEKVMIQSIAHKTMSANFGWMIGDKAKAKDLAGTGEIAVREALNEISPAELNKVFIQKGIKDAFDNPATVAEGIEDAISELVKGKILKYYMQNERATNDFGLIRVARKAIEINQQHYDVDSVQGFLRNMVGIVKKDSDLKRYYGDVSKYVNDKQFIKMAMHLESAGDVSFEKLFDDIQLKALNGDFDYDSIKYDDQSDIQTQLEKTLKMDEYLNTENVNYDSKYKSDETLTGYMDSIINRNAQEHVKDKYNTNSEDFDTILRKEVAKARAEKEFVPSKENKTKSSISDETKIKAKQADIYTKYHVNNTKLEDFITSAKQDNHMAEIIDIAASRVKDRYKELAELTGGKPIAEMIDKIENLNGQEYLLGIQGAISKVTNEIKQSTPVKVESMKDFVVNIDNARLGFSGRSVRTPKDAGYSMLRDRNLTGYGALKQYIDIKGGMRNVLNDKELIQLTKNMKVDNVEGFQQLAMLAHVVPGFDMKVIGKDSTGNIIEFGLKDIKLNHNDEPGLTVKDTRTGDYIQVANSKHDVTSIERINSISIDQIDIQRKNITAMQEQAPIFLKQDPSKISILPDFKGDYDKITSLAKKKFGKYDPIQSLLNTTELLNKAEKEPTKAVTIDYETSGIPENLSRGTTSKIEYNKAMEQLPDEVKDYIRKNNPSGINRHQTIMEMYNKGDMDIHLFNKLPKQIQTLLQGDMFRPVQAAIQEVDITNSVEGYKFNGGKITNIFMKPTDNIVNHLNKLDSDYLAQDLNSNDTWLARNYAKYDMPDAAKDIQISDGNVFFKNSDNTLTNSGKSVKEFADQINQSAKKVVEHLSGNAHADLEDVIPSRNIYANQADFMSAVVKAATDESGNALPTIAHNFSNAEMPWTKEFLTQAKKLANKQLEAMKKENSVTISDLTEPQRNLIDSLKDSFNIVDYRIKDYEEVNNIEKPVNHGLSISQADQDSSKRIIWNGEDISGDPTKLKAYTKSLNKNIIGHEEYERLLRRRDELKGVIDSKEKELKTIVADKKAEFKTNIDNKIAEIKAYNTPIVSDGIDTLHIAKMVEPGRTDNRLTSLIADKGIESVGHAHLGDVDIVNTTKLLENLVNQPQMKGLVEAANKPLEVGDIIIKHNTDANGVQFNKGIYQLVNKPKKVDGGIRFDFEDLESKSSDIVSVVAPNIGTMNREATRNWIRFKPDNIEIAKTINNDMVKLDSLRTLNNAMSNANTWALYKTRAQENGNEGMINRLNTLKEHYDSAITKSVENAQQPLVHGIKKFSSEPYTDIEHLALGNSNKLGSDYFNKEVNRLSQPISDRRMKEYNAVGNYANSDEGKLVEKHLNAIQDRLNAKVINKDEYNSATADMINTIKKIKGDHNTGMVEVKDNITLGDIDGKLLTELGGGGKDKLTNFAPRRFNLDLTDGSTLTKSIWNFTNQLGVALKNNGAVTSTEEGKMKALNKYVLPILQKNNLVPTGDHWDNIAKNAFNIDAKEGAKVVVPPSAKNMLPVVVDHIMDNKADILANPAIEHLQEVDMFKATTKDSAPFEEINKSLAKQLKELDHQSAMIPTDDGWVHSSNLAKVNDHLVDIATVSREHSNTMTDGTVPFINVMTPSSATRSKELELPTLVEYNNINPVSSELAKESASTIKQMADSIKVDRQVMSPEYFASKLKYNKPGSSARQQALDTMPEYTEVIRNSEGNRAPDYISSLNEHTMSKLEDVEKDIRSGLDFNREARANMYKELANRASQSTPYRTSNYDDRITTVDEANITKTNAMKALGWMQKDSNDNWVSGKIGLNGRVQTGELDPSKVLLTTKASLGTNKSGHYSGLALTDVSLGELQRLSESNFTPKMERSIIRRYLDNNNSDDLRATHSDEIAEQNYQKTLLNRRNKQYSETNGLPKAEPLANRESKDSTIEELNKSIIERGRKANANTVERSPVSEAIEGMRNTIQDIGSESRSALREIMSSKAAIAAGLGLAFVGALALTRKQHSSDGGTPEQKPNGKGAPTVDGNYDNGYNNNDNTAKRMAGQKTARVEENGKGMTVSVRAKNPGRTSDQQVQDAVSNAVSSSIDTKISIHNTDDRSTIDSNYVSNLFAQALGGGK